MQFFKRIGLFVLTNLLIVVTIGIVWSLIATFTGIGKMGGIATLMAFCLVLGMTGSIISLLMSKWMAKTLYRVRVLDPKGAGLSAEARWLVETVHQIARRAKLEKMPEVGVYDSPDVNAFATGPTKNNSLVAVSTGLLQKMNRMEIEGVLGHEVAHISNGDMVTMTLIQGIVNSIAFFFSRILAGIISSYVDERMRNSVRFAVTILGDMLFTLLGSMIVAYFSRRREFRADAGSARLVSPAHMLAALHKLQAVYALPLESSREERDSLAALKISHRQKPGLLMSLLLTHPPIEDRIAALK